MSNKKYKLAICTVLAIIAAMTSPFAAQMPEAKAYSDTHRTLITDETTVKDMLPSNLKLYGRLTYEENNENGITITGCAEDTKWIKLTGTINGKPITKIADDAFAKCTELENVVIGDKITYIGKHAFSNTAIRYITLGANVTYVDDEAFAGCKNLKHVYVYNTTDAEPYIGKDVFKDCNKEFTLYCGLLSGWSTYAKDHNVRAIRNRKYCINWEEPKHIYVVTTKDDWLNRVKRIKLEPDPCPEIEFDITEDENGLLFNRSGIYVTWKDYYVLCNCTANEYGANWVPVWEMALVPEVIFNIQARTGDPTIYDTVKPYPRFEGSEKYIELEEFYYKVNDRVIYAVNLYLAYPEYFNEGYYQFRGDGTWNYFWGDN